jgi:TolB-like protein
MTDELISDLGQISALRVISRTSAMGYKHAREPLPQIARELNVDAVVEGTVLRSGDRVRITAQLIEARPTSTYALRAMRVNCGKPWRSRARWLEPLQIKFGSI